MLSLPIAHISKKGVNIPIKIFFLFSCHLFLTPAMPTDYTFFLFSLSDIFTLSGMIYFLGMAVKHQGLHFYKHITLQGVIYNNNKASVQVQPETGTPLQQVSNSCQVTIVKQVNLDNSILADQDQVDVFIIQSGFISL